jgi:hypothetical protein
MVRETFSRTLRPLNHAETSLATISAVMGATSRGAAASARLVTEIAGVNRFAAVGEVVDDEELAGSFFGWAMTSF